MATVSQRKRHCRCSDTIRTAEFTIRVQAIVSDDPDPGKSLRTHARDVEVDEVTIRGVVHVQAIHDAERTVLVPEKWGEPSD